MTTPNQSLNFDHTNTENGVYSVDLKGNSGTAIYSGQAAGGGGTPYTIVNDEIGPETQVVLTIIYPLSGPGELVMGQQEKLTGSVSFILREVTGQDTEGPIKIDMKLW